MSIAGGSLQTEMTYYDVEAEEFGVEAVRGSGATPSRLNLYRRRDNMKGKRVVVWCLSVREFTEGQGWRLVPVIR